jgi:TrmH family RNA methyltransferase
MKRIDSIHNQEIKQVAALAHSKNRYEQKRFIAEGQRVIATFIEYGWKPLALYATDKTFESVQTVAPDFPITLVSESVMRKISQASTPSEFLAVFSIPPYAKATGDKPALPTASTLTPGLVLANLADPGNVGTLIRTCAAMNVRTVVMVEGVDPWSPKVVQASAGALAMVTIVSVQWHELVASKGTLKLYALVAQGGSTFAAVNAHNALLVVGNEARGIPQEWLAHCDGAITIPMPGNTESLNAAVAGSIALYELFGG